MTENIPVLNYKFTGSPVRENYAHKTDIAL
jgi:hypothetical protein